MSRFLVDELLKDDKDPESFQGETMLRRRV